MYTHDASVIYYRNMKMERKKLMVFSFLKKTSFGRINEHFTPHNEMEFSSRIDIQLYGSRWWSIMCQ